MSTLRTGSSKATTTKTVGALLLFLAALLLFLAASPARAAEFDVTTTGDPTLDGCTLEDCSLREAVIAANAASGPDEINLGAETYELSIAGINENASASGDLDIRGDLTINGAGARSTTVDANGIDRVFQIVGGPTAEINGLTITGGVTGDALGGLRDSGGGVLIFPDANLTLEEVAVSGNNAASGGGISSSFARNLTLDSSTVSGNEASIGGGGIHSSALPDFSTKTTIVNSTVSDNTAGGRGGGVFNAIGLTEIKNSTVTNNTAPGGSGGGVASYGDNMTRTDVSSSIIAANANTDVDFVFGNENSFRSNGHNLIGDGNATGAFNQTADQIIGGASPGLEADADGKPLLADNGGPTDTHAVEEGSPALDKGKSNGLTEDQRGTAARPFDFPGVASADGGDGSDIGAFERNPGTVQFSSATYNAGEGDGTATITVIRTVGADGEGDVGVGYATSDGGTATAGQDYDARSDVLTFADGETEKTFTVGITNDDIDESDETVNLALSGPTGGAALGDPDEATLTITDNDDEPTFSIDDVAVTEGDAGTTDATFTVTLSAVSGKPVTVDYATADDTARAPGDYASTSGKLAFEPGDTEKTITVLVNGDTAVEPDEAFEVNLDNPANATISDGTRVGTIENDDESPAAPPANPARCTIVGAPGNDILRGTPGRDVICGLGGGDVIYGGGGNDIIRGGPGNDLVFGGVGNDIILGGAGGDVLRGGVGNDVLIGGPGGDLLRGEGGNDRLNIRDGVRGNDIANGGPGRDACFADARDVRRGCP